MRWRTGWMSVSRGQFFGAYPILIGLCLSSINIQFQYPILGAPFLLLFPAVAIALVVFKAVLLAKHFVGQDPAERAEKAILKFAETLCAVFLWGFVVFGALVYLNGKLDDQPPYRLQATLASLSKFDVKYGLRFSLSWTSLRSGNDPEHPRPLLLNTALRRNRWGGEAVLVEVRPGFLGWSWVDGMEQDQEYYAKAILKINPNAQRGWRKLIGAYQEQNRLEEATATVYEYLKHFPNDVHLAFDVGSLLVTAGFAKEGIRLLEYVVERRPVYGAYQSLGYALQSLGKLTEAAAVYETSLPLAPDDWEVYYHLGEVYAMSGHPERSIGMYEAVLKRQSNFPEVKERLISLRVAEAHKGGT